MAKLAAMPDSTTTLFCQNGFSRYVRPMSSGSTSSSTLIPTMRTYPPAGIAFTPYSVSPRLIDQMRGPNPTKNSLTLIPSALAAKKWPAS